MPIFRIITLIAEAWNFIHAIDKTMLSKHDSDKIECAKNNLEEAQGLFKPTNKQFEARE